MDISYIIFGISAVVQAIIGYEMGDLVMNALGYTSTRTHTLGDAFVILICILVRYGLDRWLVLGREKQEGGFSPIILDVVFFVLGTIISLISLEMYATNTVSVTLAVMLLMLVFSLLYEKDIYMGEVSAIPAEEQDDPYGLDDEGDGTEKAENVEKTIQKSIEENDIELEIVGEDEDDDIELEIEEWKSKEESEWESNEASKEETDDDELNDDELVDRILEDEGLKPFVTEIVRLLAVISTVMAGVLVLADIVAEKYSPVYYMLVALVAALAVILRAVSRGMDGLLKNTSQKVHFIGFSVTVVAFTIVLCIKSILIGLVFLLGAYLVKLIIPMAMNYWGTGGTVAVKQKIDILSRFVTRLFVLIILVLDVWLLSYGAIWEIDFMIILSIPLGACELLMKQNYKTGDGSPSC